MTMPEMRSPLGWMALEGIPSWSKRAPRGQLRDELCVETGIGLGRGDAVGRGVAPEILGLQAQGKVVRDVVGRHVLEIEIAASQPRARAIAVERAALAESGGRRVPGRHRGT